MPKPPKSAIQRFLDAHEPIERAILLRLRDVVRAAAPDAEEQVKRDSLTFADGDGVLCYLWPQRNCVQLGVRERLHAWAAPARAVRSVEEIEGLRRELETMIHRAPRSSSAGSHGARARF